jgi:tRNA A-37 threonylcarbamoyl transferase component Bud32
MQGRLFWRGGEERIRAPDGVVVISPAQIGSYRVERLLGVGSFATVWLGFDPALGARVAIKVLADNWSHDLRVRERFLDEGRLLWRLDHRRVVRVYSLGELPDGRPYLVMLWADGGSLGDRLAAGPLPVGQGVWLLREIAAGVAVLHANGIVHRDLTPGNVLLRSGPAGSEQVMIADLGLAKAVAAASGLTARAGTPGYMAPEQDDPLAVVDTRTDVYGLGRLGARLLGTPATGGFDTGVRLRDGVPEKVAGVLATATARLPADRYRDAAAFAVALGRATTARPATATPAATIAVPRRRRAVALAAVLTAVGAAMVSDSVGSPPRPAAAVAVDATGRITIVLPRGWRAEGDGWEERRETSGALEPALAVSPAPDRWKTDPAVPGAFIGLSRELATRTTPAAFIAAHRHTGCVAAQVRTSRQAGIDWVVAHHSSCPGAKTVIVETAGVGPGDAGLVYAQIAPPAGSGPAFVDTLLAGVRVR